MAGIFNTPEEIRELEEQQRINQYRNPHFGRVRNHYGRAAENIVGGLFGHDMRSDARKQAEQMQGLMKGLDMRDQSSIGNTINALMQSGNQAEAFKLMQYLKEEKPVEKWSTPTWKEKEGRRYLTSTNSLTGETKKLDAFNILDGKGSGTTLGINSTWNTKVAPSKEDRPALIQQIASEERFQTLFGDQDIEAITPLLTPAIKIANQIKRREANERVDLFGNKSITPNKFKNEASPDDLTYLYKAIKQMKDSGAYSAFTDDSIGQDSTKFNPDLNLSLEGIEKKTAELDERAALSQIYTPDPVASAPSGNINNLTKLKASQAFTKIGELDNGQMKQVLEGQGMDLSDSKVLADSMVRWDSMRAYPKFTKNYVKALGNFSDIQALKSEMQADIDADLKSGRVTAGLRKRQIARYLDRVKGTVKKVRKSGRSGRGSKPTRTLSDIFGLERVGNQNPRGR